MSANPLDLSKVSGTSTLKTALESTLTTANTGLELTVGSTTYRWNGSSFDVVSIGGAALVNDSFRGIARTRWVSVVAGTAPIAGTSGCITFTNPVFGVKVTSMMVSAGTMPLTAVNPVMRVAIDAANDAAALILLPTIFPSASTTADAGQITSFNIPFVYVPDTEAAGELRVGQINFPTSGIEIPVSRDGIYRLDFGHNVTGMTFIVGVTALEAV